jgi:protein O-GlcNAc transferase
MANVERWFADALRYQRAGDADAAYRVGRKVLDADPGHAGALRLCGGYLLAHGNPQGALPLLSRAAEAHPEDTDAAIDLARALQAAGQADEALAALRRAVAAAPESAAAHKALGDLLRDAGAFAEAVAAYREAMRLAPDDPDPDMAAGSVLMELGDVAAAREHRRGTVARHPGNPAAEDNAVFVELYDPDVTPEAIKAVHEAWGRTQAERTGGRAARDHANDPDPDRPLKVGYLSPDFRKHPVGMFVASILASHDPKAVVPYAYASVRKPDDVTAVFRRVCPNWRDVRAVSDAEVAAQVRRDGIDILVDLAGLTGDNRLRVLAYRPAPVQATYLGYPATTGLAAVDFRLTDAVANPPGTEDYFTEALARVEGGFCCYMPPPDSPPVGSPPVVANGYVTFGTAMNTIKINPRVVAVWSRVLQEVPTARLLLARGSFRSEALRERFRRDFAAHGVDPDRIDFEGTAAMDTRDALAAYGRMDIALDTFPYNGHTTTCEALWMGLPVIVLEGRSFIDRVGVSLLAAAGIDDMAADTQDAYVALAAAWAADPARLADVRAEQRRRLAGSALLDAPGRTRAVEAAYREMWRAWCAGRGDG